MRGRISAAAIILVLVLHARLSAQLVVRPSLGNSVGVVSAPEAGKWLVFGPGTLKSVQPTVLDGGKACVFEGSAGEYAVVFLPPGDGQPLVANVVLGGAAPVPPDPTPPDPTPDLTAFALQVRDWATTLVPPIPRLKSQQVAQSFSTVRSQMAAGTLKTPEAVIAATYQANLAALGDARDEWAPFREQLRAELNGRSKAGTLQTIAQHMAVWDEIAAGLRAVK